MQANNLRNRAYNGRQKEGVCRGVCLCIPLSTPRHLVFFRIYVLFSPSLLCCLSHQSTQGNTITCMVDDLPSIFFCSNNQIVQYHSRALIWADQSQPANKNKPLHTVGYVKLPVETDVCVEGYFVEHSWYRNDNKHLMIYDLVIIFVIL